MIRIALCDDNKEDMLQLHQKIIEWYRENSKNQSVSITEYSDSVYLSSVIDAGDSHDVFFLDVEMPKVDGFQLADKIRNKLPAAIIVFLTSHSELAPDGYKFRALRYVSKLVLSQKLPEALEAVQKEFSALESGYLVVPHYTDALRIPYNEILYVQHILRSSQIYTLRQGVIKDNRGLRQHRTIAEASAVESPIRQETIGFPAHFFARAHNFKPPGRACQPEADSPMRT